MALRAVKGLIKFENFMRDLGLTYYQAIGILEALWHFTATNSIQGDIGKHPNEDIAAWIGYTGDANKLIEVLTVRRWLDPHSKHRLIVHDWHIHADKSVKATLKNRNLRFCMPEELTEIPKEKTGNQDLKSGSLSGSGSGSGAEYGAGAEYGSGSGAASPTNSIDDNSPFELPPPTPRHGFPDPLEDFQADEACDARTVWAWFCMQHHGNALRNLHSDSTHKELRHFAKAIAAHGREKAMAAFTNYYKDPPKSDKALAAWQIVQKLGLNVTTEPWGKQSPKMSDDELLAKVSKAMRGET